MFPILYIDIDIDIDRTSYEFLLIDKTELSDLWIESQYKWIYSSCCLALGL